MAIGDADEKDILRLFIELLPPERWELLEAELEGDHRPQVFTLRVVAAMMLLQRLDGHGTQAEVVRKLAEGQLDRLLPDSKRVRAKNISCNAGAYCAACGQFPEALLKKACAEMLAELAQRIRPAVAEPDLVVMLVDGTGISLAHDSALLEHYPPSLNQHGKAHWGMLRVVVLHDVYTGLALSPQWGPMYGSHAVSEQQLAEQALQSAPPGCVILGDGNFGIFSFAHSVVQSQRHVLLRLTAQRAKALGATKLLPKGEESIVWKPTRKDREKNPQLPENAEIRGRLIAVLRPGYSDPLYLFTTLPFTVEKAVAVYALRWNVEVDLRSLKHTLGLFHLRGKSKEAIGKELLMATVAYAMVRAFMALAARRSGVEPRRLSFTAACSLLELTIGKLCCGNRPQRELALDRLLRLIASCKLPNRSKPRRYERAVWGFRQTFPLKRANGKPPQIKWH